ncbi:MAG: Bax inhibitor-1 family protein [Candidatus Ranarchaeia archaeon]
MGAGLFGSVFFFADLISAQILPEALILTSGVFIIAVLYQWITRKDLSHWSWWVFFLLLVAIGLTFAEIVVQVTLFRIAVDLFVVILFVFIVMWDMYTIRELIPNEEWMRGVLEFFLDFANILIRIIMLLIEIAAQSS